MVTVPQKMVRLERGCRLITYSTMRPFVNSILVPVGTGFLVFFNIFCAWLFSQFAGDGEVFCFCLGKAFVASPLRTCSSPFSKEGRIVS